jgi:hypothetical protein
MNQVAAATHVDAKLCRMALIELRNFKKCVF